MVRWSWIAIVVHTQTNTVRFNRMFSPQTHAYCCGSPYRASMPRSFLQWLFAGFGKKSDLLLHGSGWVKTAFHYKWFRDADTRVFANNISDSDETIPLLLCFRALKERKDYKSLLAAIRNLMDLTDVVCDFERAVWNAVEEVFGGVHIMGCNFHWKQAILKKARNFGLASGYSKHCSFPREIIIKTAVPIFTIVWDFRGIRKNRSNKPFQLWE